MIIRFRDGSTLECEHIDFIHDEICVDGTTLYDIEKIKVIANGKSKIHSDYADGHLRHW